MAERGCLADLVLFQRRGEKGTALDEAFEGPVLGAGRLAMAVAENDITLPTPAAECARCCSAG